MYRFLSGRSRTLLSLVLFFTCFCPLSHAEKARSPSLEVATFSADITPPVGAPLCFGNIRSAESVEEPLTARGVVLRGPGKPIVLCVADFVVIANASHDAWREALAEAADTTPDRVAMHVLHNHDAPGCDLSAMDLLDRAAPGVADRMALREAHEAAIRKTAEALRESASGFSPVTGIGLGTGVVEKFASNRRLIGPDGKLQLGRMSSTRDPKARAAPEGTIDPVLSLVSFWNGETCLAALTFYASHPQSYYGKGGITPDTVGLARNRRSAATGVFHIHFDGAGGNIAAGKYNDGSPEAREALTGRAEEGMALAWERQERRPLGVDEVAWEVEPVRLPWRGRYGAEELAAQIADPDATVRERVLAARDAVYLRRWEEGHEIDIACLRLGDAHVLFFPGELFVEYQLAAKAMRPGDFIAVAAYGDGGPGYIGSAIAYSQGGYEVGRVSRTAPSVESVLSTVTQRLLDVSER